MSIIRTGETLVSIIIPVFNTEKYIRRCVDSVRAQTYKATEIILINDGSSDSSGEICDEYSKKGHNIQVYHDENKGAAVSRNKGIELARGEYILFLDSDDYYNDNTAIEQMVKFALKYNLDMLCFNYKYKLSGKGESIDLGDDKEPKFIYNNKHKMLEVLIRQNLYTSSSCIKLIKLSVLLENNVSFKQGLRCEDILFSFELLLYCNNIAYLSSKFYSYTVRIGSTTNTIIYKTIQDMLYSVDKMCYLADKHQNDNYNLYMSYIAFQFTTLLINMYLVEEKLSENCKKKIFARKFLLRYNYNKYVRLVYFCSLILGVKITSKLLYIYFNLKRR